MRISLNDRATAELIQIMAKLGTTNPTHAANVVISKIHQELIQELPTREDTNHDNRSTSNL